MVHMCHLPYMWYYVWYAMSIYYSQAIWWYRSRTWWLLIIYSATTTTISTKMTMTKAETSSNNNTTAIAFKKVSAIKTGSQAMYDNRIAIYGNNENCAQVHTYIQTWTYMYVRIYVYGYKYPFHVLPHQTGITLLPFWQKLHFLIACKHSSRGRRNSSPTAMNN